MSVEVHEPRLAVEAAKNGAVRVLLDVRADAGRAPESLVRVFVEELIIGGHRDLRSSLRAGNR